MINRRKMRALKNESISGFSYFSQNKLPQSDPKKKRDVTFYWTRPNQLKMMERRGRNSN